jgi:hypothetical protein
MLAADLSIREHLGDCYRRRQHVPMDPSGVLTIRDRLPISSGAVLCCSHGRRHALGSGNLARWRR